MSVKAVMLDIDDTLLDFGACSRYAMLEAAKEFSLAFPEDYYDIFRRINNGLWLEIEAGKLTVEGLRDVRWQAIFREYGVDFDGRVFEDRFKDNLNLSAEPVEGALDLLRYLQGRGYILTAASNGPYGQQVRRLDSAGMLGYFDHLFISERVGAVKPSAAFFDVCFRELAPLRPEEVMMIGDSLTADIRGAADYGMRTCWFDIHRTAAVPRPGPDHIVERLEEVCRVL